MIQLGQAKKTAKERCEYLQLAIVDFEFTQGKPCHFKRAELAAWRRLLYGCGVLKEDLTPMPPLDPAIHQFGERKSKKGVDTVQS